MTQYLEHFLDRVPRYSTCWIRGGTIVVLNEMRDASLLCSGRLKIKQDPIVSCGSPNGITSGNRHLNERRGIARVEETHFTSPSAGGPSFPSRRGGLRLDPGKVGERSSVPRVQPYESGA